jgi:hypothetical protein
MQTNVQEVALDPLNGGPGNNWTVHHGGQSGSTPSTYPQVSLLKDSGPWIIHFKINNPGNNITFAADPIWVQQNSKPASHTIDSQINGIVASSDGKELFVLDKNDNPNGQTLYYSLHFTGHGQVDPIIDNGGHSMIGAIPTTTTAANTVTLQYAVFGVVLLAAFIVGAIVGRLVRRR